MYIVQGEEESYGVTERARARARARERERQRETEGMSKREVKSLGHSARPNSSEPAPSETHPQLT